MDAPRPCDNRRHASIPHDIHVDGHNAREPAFLHEAAPNYDRVYHASIDSCPSNAPVQGSAVSCEVRGKRTGLWGAGSILLFDCSF